MGQVAIPSFSLTSTAEFIASRTPYCAHPDYADKLPAQLNTPVLKCSVRSVQLTVYSVQCTMYSVQCTVYSVQCTVYSVQCTQYITMYTVQCSVYCTVQCTVQCKVTFAPCSLRSRDCGISFIPHNIICCIQQLYTCPYPSFCPSL